MHFLIHIFTFTFILINFFLSPSEMEEAFDESTRNLVLATYENLQESDATEEARIGGRCVCKRPPCPCDRRSPRSEEEQRRKKCRNGFTWPHCN